MPLVPLCWIRLWIGSHPGNDPRSVSVTAVQPRIPPAPLLLAKPLLPQQRKVILQSLNIKFNTVYSQKNQWGLNLAVWQSIFVTANIIMTLYMYGVPILNCQIYVCQYLCRVCHSHQYNISIVVTYLYRSKWVRSSCARWSECLPTLSFVSLCDRETTQLVEGLFSTKSWE